MRRALLQLPAARREVLVLSRYEFQTYEEIAHALGCSVSAVKVRAHRALKQLGDIYRDLTGEVRHELRRHHRIAARPVQRVGHRRRRAPPRGAPGRLRRLPREGGVHHEALERSRRRRSGRARDAVPHERMRARFHAALAAYEASAGARTWRFLPERFANAVPLAAAAAALLAVGVLIGHAWPSARDRDVAELRAEVRGVGLALLDHQSASDGCSAWRGRSEPARGRSGERAARARAGRSEPSVRLAAIEALRSRLDQPEVAPVSRPRSTGRTRRCCR